NGHQNKDYDNDDDDDNSGDPSSVAAIVSRGLNIAVLSIGITASRDFAHRGERPLPGVLALGIHRVDDGNVGYASFVQTCAIFRRDGQIVVFQIDVSAVAFALIQVVDF